MQKSDRHLLAVATFSLPLLLTGCASQPPAAPPAPVVQSKNVSGDQMIRDSQGIAQIGSRWQDGKNLVDKGQALMRQGQTQVDQGQNMVNEGQKIMQDSEDSYRNLKQ